MIARSGGGRATGEGWGEDRPGPDVNRPHEEGALGTEERASLEAQAGAYALDALHPAEAAAFARHLETCAFCRGLVCDFFEVASELTAPLAAVEASPALKQRLLAAVQQDDLGAPVQATVQAALEEPGAAIKAESGPPAGGPGAPEVLLPFRSGRGREFRPRGGGVAMLPPRQFWRAWPPSAMAAVAALLLCSAGLGAWNVAFRPHPRMPAATAAQYEAALAAAAGGRFVRIVALAPVDGGATTGPVVLVVPASDANEAPRLVVANLPPPPPERTYQVWLVRQGTPQDAGTFQTAAGTPVQVVSLRGDSAGADAVAITVEPAGSALV